MFILDSIAFFLPHIAAAAALALLFGVALRNQFSSAPAPVTPGPRGFFVASARAASFFWTFAMFGAVVAYFLSLGLQEGETDLSNSLLGTFASPLIALLTAGVSYFAKKGAPDGSINAVAAGVTCFLLQSVLSYRAFYLAAINTGLAAPGVAGAGHVTGT